MKIIRYKTPEEFLQDAKGFLEVHEAENNLMLGIAARKKYKEYFCASILENNAMQLAALMTPPHQLIISNGPSAAIEELVNFITNENIQLPGIMGPDNSAEKFAELWKAQTGVNYSESMSQLIYECNEISDLKRFFGIMKEATLDDIKFVGDCLSGFHQDIYNEKFSRNKKEAAIERIQADGIYLWQDKESVSMCAASGKTANGIRIGGVYTPPEFRKKGYATACVAALTKKMLNEGNRFCFLYTDASNSTSNKIYRKIGYKEVCESKMIKFKNKPEEA